jgi:hypothetical protein
MCTLGNQFLSRGTISFCHGASQDDERRVHNALGFSISIPSSRILDYPHQFGRRRVTSCQVESDPALLTFPVCSEFV